MPENEASKEIDKLHRELNTAQHQWETYAAALGRGYTVAYRRQRDTLEFMKEQRRASSEAMYFLLSLLCAGFAGGLVGGLLAPWVREAGREGAKVILGEVSRETFREINKEAAKSGARGSVELHREYTQRNQDPYHPAGVEPLEYYLDMKTELGLCFSALRDQVDKWKRQAIQDGSPHLFGVMIYNLLTSSVLLKDQPKTEHMPEKDRVEREAELMMWIAWANSRDIDYWNHRIKTVTNRRRDYNDAGYIAELAGLNPIQNRMRALKADHYVMTDISDGTWQAGSVLNMNSLRLLGTRLGGPIFKRVADVIKAPHMELVKMTVQPPIYRPSPIQIPDSLRLRKPGSSSSP